MTDRVLVNCTVVDAEADVPRADAAVWIRDGRIEAVGPVEDVLDAAGRDHAELLDLHGAHVAPGLLNMHCHLGINPPSRDSARLARETDAEMALRMAMNARRTLDAGVTTVRLTGEKHHVDFSLRRAIDRGEVPGPRIRSAGMSIACSGGHGTHEGPCNSWGMSAEGDGVGGIRRIVRQQLKAGADFIKIMASGGNGGEHENPGAGVQLAEDELQAAIETAHAWRSKATAHALTEEAVRLGVELGLDCVEHGTRIAEDVAQRMGERGVWLVPTLSVTRCGAYLRELGVPPYLLERNLALGPVHADSFRRARAHGVQVAVGTDLMPFDRHDETWATVREVEHFVELGMSDRDAFAAATIRPAEWLGMDGEIGTVEVGKHADLIAMPGNPVDDASALRGIAFVMKGGAVHRDALSAPA